MVTFKVLAHALMLSFFYHGSDVLQPMLVSYDFISHLMCHRRMHLKLPFLPLLSLPLECKLAPFVSRVHAFDALFVSARLFSLFILICARFNQLQSVVCLSFLLCLFFDSTNSERCFAILRANTNYNFLIYGNDFTQIQDIRSHCRTSALLITTGNQIISKLFDYRCCLLRLNWLFVN